MVTASSRRLIDEVDLINRGVGEASNRRSRTRLRRSAVFEYEERVLKRDVEGAVVRTLASVSILAEVHRGSAGAPSSPPSNYDEISV